MSSQLLHGALRNGKSRRQLWSLYLVVFAAIGIWPAFWVGLWLGLLFLIIPLLIAVLIIARPN